MASRIRRIVSLWQAGKLCEATLSRAEDLFDRLMSKPKEPERKGNGAYVEKGKDSGKGKSAGAGKGAGKGKGKDSGKGKSSKDSGKRKATPGDDHQARKCYKCGECGHRASDCPWSS